MARAHEMGLGARSRTGDRNLSRTANAKHAIGGNRKLKSHLRALHRLVNQIGTKSVLRLLRHQSGFNGYARLLKHGVALAVNAAVRIDHRGYDACDPCRYQGFGAGRRRAVMGARFERYIGGCAARQLASLCKRNRLGVGTSPLLRDTAADNMIARCIMANDQAGDRRVRSCLSLIAAGKPNGCGHVSLI